MVAPFVGVWIEINESPDIISNHHVAPFVGVWIEILRQLRTIEIIMVAPFVGVWIEIVIKLVTSRTETLSLPSWECGLKSFIRSTSPSGSLSLPSWECGLKFFDKILSCKTTYRRSLCGSVD